MATSEVFRALGDEQYVSLTTFRRSGTPVATAVWVARDGDALVVTTGGASGKIKRLRNDRRIELRPCTRSGSVADDAPVAHGTAEVVTDPTVGEQLRKPIAAKYGLQYTVMTGVQRVASVARADRSSRVMIRIVESPASGGTAE